MNSGDLHDPEACGFVHGLCRVLSLDGADPEPDFSVRYSLKHRISDLGSYAAGLYRTILAFCEYNTPPRNSDNLTHVHTTPGGSS